MDELIFIVFEDEGGGYNAIEGKHNLIVVGRDRTQMKEEIRKAVAEQFDGNFTGKTIVREVLDEVISF